MKKVLLIFFIIILLLVFIVHYSNNPKNAISKLLINSKNTQGGELRYRIYLLGFLPVGEATLATEKIEEYKGQKVYHLMATGQTLKSFSKLFSAYAAFDSYIDMVKHNPLVFKQKIVVSDKPDKNTEILYNQKNNLMSINGIERNIFPNTQDPLSALFNIKHMDFGKVKELEININTNQKNYTLKGTAASKDISIRRKTYKIYVLQAEINRRDKNPLHSSKLNVVLLKRDSDANLPILIKVFAGGFLLDARLVEIK